jgi:hypothetical protein
MPERSESHLPQCDRVESPTPTGLSVPTIPT